MKVREHEKIGGGFFVFRRGKKTGRIGVKRNAIAFEHPDEPSAFKEAQRLAGLNPGETFEVFQTTGVRVRDTPSPQAEKG